MFIGLSEPRRVVITGFGCATPIGIGRDAFWGALERGESGVRTITAFDASSAAVRIAAEVQDLDRHAEPDPKFVRHLPRTVPLALCAAREAVADSGTAFHPSDIDGLRRVGVEIGTGGGGLAFTEEQYKYWYLGPQRNASVYTIASSTPGVLSSEISMEFGFRGLSHIVSTGCTSSTDAIFYAAQHIALGRQDLMIAGGVDAPIAPGILAGFELMTVLTKDWNDAPERASRPFSADRSGIVLGEGAYIFVLESMDAAIARGADIYAEIAGYGSTCDAYHRVRLEESGAEPARAISVAIADAGLRPEDIDHVNLHGTATQLNDRIETAAVRLALGKHAYAVPMSATKSQIGHPQGASGAAGIASALLALKLSVIAPTINLDKPDPECDLNYVPNIAQRHQVRNALCNCIGFGSKNSAIVLRKVGE